WTTRLSGSDGASSNRRTSSPCSPWPIPPVDRPGRFPATPLLHARGRRGEWSRCRLGRRLGPRSSVSLAMPLFLRCPHRHSWQPADSQLGSGAAALPCRVCGARTPLPTVLVTSADPPEAEDLEATLPPGESEHEALPPPTVPGYEVLRELGRGGMGVV